MPQGRKILSSTIVSINFLLSYCTLKRSILVSKGIMKFDVLSEFFEGIINGTVNLDQTREESLKIQEAERVVSSESLDSKEPQETTSFDGLEDETLIDESGYGGYNPHEGVDLEHLLKLTGGFNPHAPSHAGHDSKANPNKVPESDPSASSGSGTEGKAPSPPDRDEL